jgi:hypothetical protein
MPPAAHDNPRRLAALALCLLVTACGTTAKPSATTSSTQTVTVTPTATSAPAAPPPKPAPSPGSLPQTHQLPSAHTGTFRAEMASLWRGIVANSVHTALPAFFPEQAYVRLKSVADPAGDYRNRLVAAYRLDLAAAHALVAPGDRLVAVNVPTAYAHWVPPGVCYNTIGYYEVPNARVVYTGQGGTKSFGIASMISWRGVWYVVHLGSVLSPGTVDDPSAGPGVSAASSTC